MLLILAENHREGSPLAMPYRVYGTLLIAGVLIPLSFGDFCKDMAHEWSRGVGAPVVHATWEFVGILILLAATLAGCVVARVWRARENESAMIRLLQLAREQWCRRAWRLLWAFWDSGTSRW